MARNDTKIGMLQLGLVGGMKLAQTCIHLGRPISARVSRVLDKASAFEFDKFKSLLRNPDSANIIRFDEFVFIEVLKPKHAKLHIPPRDIFSENPLLVKRAFREICNTIICMKGLWSQEDYDLKLDISTFWLRRENARGMLASFLLDEGICYEETYNGPLDMSMCWQYTAIFPLRQSANILDTGQATWVITIPGKKEKKVEQVVPGSTGDQEVLGLIDIRE